MLKVIFSFLKTIVMAINIRKINDLILKNVKYHNPKLNSILFPGFIEKTKL